MNLHFFCALGAFICSILWIIMGIIDRTNSNSRNKFFWKPEVICGIAWLITALFDIFIYYM